MSLGNACGEQTCFSTAYFLHHFVAEMDKFGEQILEVIMKIRTSIKRSNTKSIFQLITMDAATNITMEDTKEKIQTLAETSVIEVKTPSF